MVLGSHFLPGAGCSVHCCRSHQGQGFQTSPRDVAKVKCLNPSNPLVVVIIYCIFKVVASGTPNHNFGVLLIGVHLFSEFPQVYW